MLTRFRLNQRRFPNGLLWLVLLPLVLISCRRQPQVPAAPPPPPPPPNLLELGDLSFGAGDYPAAIAAYSEYLRDHPNGAEGDRVLFQLGMAFALPANPSQDPVQAVGYMNQLVSRFPESPWRPPAELLTSLQSQIQQLQLEVAQRESQLSLLTAEMEQLSQQQSSALEQLEGDLKNREDRIQELSRELERLKAIDMQRRPAMPPR